MNVKFIDTSVMLNLLEVPERCADVKEIQEQLKISMANKDTLVLPIATIIETGNHIAHIGNGNIRRKIAGKFGEYLRKTAEEEAPWQFYGVSMDKKELLYLAGHMEESAMREMGIGDMSIVYAYERYIKEMPAIGDVMIWTTDKHLKGYHVKNVSFSRRREK